MNRLHNRGMNKSFVESEFEFNWIETTDTHKKINTQQ